MIRVLGIIAILLQASLCHAFIFSPPSRNRSAPRKLMASPSPSENPAAFSPAMAISPAGADIAMAAAEGEAATHGWDVTICVCDAGGVPLRVKRNNAFAASYEIATGKARSAALFGKDTGILEDAANVWNGNGRASLLSSSFVLMRGGVPIVINGVCCGAVGVSGVLADQDEQIARAATEALAKCW